MPYRTTINHDEIRAWIERHGGHPAILRGTSNENTFGALRIDFNGHPDLEHISWDAFFDRLDTGDLAFRYNDDIPEEASPENHFKLVNREYMQSPQGGWDTLPDSGGEEWQEENVYPSSRDHHEQGPHSLDENADDAQNVW